MSYNFFIIYKPTPPGKFSYNGIFRFPGKIFQTFFVYNKEIGYFFITFFLLFSFPSFKMIVRSVHTVHLYLFV